MSFEMVRGYVQLASGLGELTRARATEAAQGLLSLSGVVPATGKMAVQVGALAEELLAAAMTNHESLTVLVRSEVEAAVTLLGLVPAEKLKESQAEIARLRAEVAKLQSASPSEGFAVPKQPAGKPAVARTAASQAAPTKTAAAKTATKPPAKKATAKKAAVKAPAKKAPAKKAAVKAPAKKATAKATATPAAATPATAASATASAATAPSTMAAPATRRSAVTTRQAPAGA